MRKKNALAKRLRALINITTVLCDILFSSVRSSHLDSNSYHIRYVIIIKEKWVDIRNSTFDTNVQHRPTFQIYNPKMIYLIYNSI